LVCETNDRLMLLDGSMGKVYSYLRFSSKGRSEGDSRRRQLKAAHDYCRTRGLKLETTTFEDLGVSAWKGKNFTEGALGAFLRAADDGLIERDSRLLVEHLDRVTREAAKSSGTVHRHCQPGPHLSHLKRRR
jgi:DNA invertase Pin-like site-specific DNA recombinase